MSPDAPPSARPDGIGRRIAPAAGGLVVYAAHMPVAYAILLGKNPRRAVPLILVLLIGLPLARRALCNRGAKAAARAMSGAYGLVLAAYFACLLYVVFPMGPARFAFMAIAAIAFGSLLAHERTRAACLLAAAPVLLAAVLHPGIALATAAALAIGLLLRRTASRSGLAPLTLAVLFFSLAVHAEAFTFYRGVSLFDRFRVPDAGVVPLPDAGDGWNLADDPGLRFAVPACEPDSWIVGRRNAEFGAIRYEQNAAEPVARGLPGLSVADNAAVDCDAGVAWIGLYETDGVAALDARTLATRSIIGLPTYPQTFASRDPATGLVYVASDFGGTIHAIDPAGGAIARTLTVPDGVAHFVVDRGGDRVVAVSGGANLYTFEAPDWAPVLRRKTAGALILQLAEDEARGVIYLSNFLAGTVEAMDAETLEPVRTRWLGPSVRFLAVLPGGDVAAAAYFGGRVIRLDGKTLATVDDRYVGKRVRWLAAAADGSILTTGIFGPVRVEYDRYEASQR